MATLNQIAENIAFKLGDQFNMTLRESIKDTVINYRGKFIRDDSDRNFISELHFSQTGVIEFEEVNLIHEFTTDPFCISAICDNPQLQDKYKVLRGKKKLPLPIRTKTSSNNPYSYLGRIDGSKVFSYTDLAKFPYVKNVKYNERTIYYTIINRRPYIINNLDSCDINHSLGICKALIKGIYENPRELYNACINGDTFVDDMDFPIGIDMLMQITNGIVKGEYGLVPKDGQQINIKPDDND